MAQLGTRPSPSWPANLRLLVSEVEGRGGRGGRHGRFGGGDGGLGDLWGRRGGAGSSSLLLKTLPADCRDLIEVLVETALEQQQQQQRRLKPSALLNSARFKARIEAMKRQAGPMLTFDLL